MRILWSSDQHTFHRRTPTHHVLNGLTKFLRVDHDLAKTDMIIFGGDFMEDLVDMQNAQGKRVLNWGSEFLDACEEANGDMIVVWLAGTSSHDREQPAHFLSVAPKGLDVRYIDKLCIEVYPTKGNLSIMWVPDNMGKMTPDEIWELALTVLKENNMTQVDMVCAHFGFDFELHAAARHHGHQLERWESICKYIILAGHIHTPCEKGKLRRSGSFDRCGHGEEHPKGGYVVDLDLEKEKCVTTFYENKNALPYLTMQVSPDAEPKALVAQVHDFIKKHKMPPFSQLKLRGGTSHVVNPVVDVISREYPMIGIETDNATNKDMLLDDEIVDYDEYEGKSLTKDNLADNLMPEIADQLAKLNLPQDEVLAVLREFQ